MINLTRPKNTEDSNKEGRLKVDYYKKKKKKKILNNILSNKKYEY